MIYIPEEIKQLLKNNVKKNLRVHFLNKERNDIVNSNIIKESFTFSESICSREKLKFGLCESSVVEFECVGIENIKGCEIEVYLEIDISGLSEELILAYGKTSSDVAFPYYQISLGVFLVDSCERQTDMKRRKVVAYSNELHDNVFLNPVEQAKFTGLINCKYNNPYNFNVYAFMYSNIGKKFNPEMFQDKEKTTIFGESCFKEILLKSSWIVYNSDKTSGNSKYALELQLYAKRELFYEDNKNLLCELAYGNVKPENMKYITDKIERICDDYGINQELEKDLSSKKELEHFLEYTKTVFFDVDGKNIDLKGHHYIYPYMGYSEKEISELKNSSGFLYSINIPRRMNIVLKEQYYTSNNVLSAKVISEEEVIFRTDDTDFVCNKITGFTEMYMNCKRLPLKINGVTKYTLSGCEINPRGIMESVMEFMTVFGRNGRNGEIELFRLADNFGLYPAETLYPEEDLFPKGSNVGILVRSCYKTAWYDDHLTKPYDRVSVTYRNESGTETYAYYALVDETKEGYDESAFQTYSLSDNYLIQNGTFTSGQIEEILSGVGEKIRNIRYMPADIELIGLPWVEAGDVITIITEDSAIDTCILRRTLSGIQSLEDNFESRG